MDKKIDNNLDEIYEVRVGYLKSNKQFNKQMTAYVLSKNQARIAVKTLKGFAEEYPDLYKDLQFDYIKASEVPKGIEISASGKKVAEDFDYAISF